MPPAVGAKAPEFTLKNAAGVGDVKLSDNFSRKNTVLLFFPLAFTGVCTKEMCDISGGLNAYVQLNADVIGVSVDNPFAQEAWAQKKNGSSEKCKSGVMKAIEFESDVAFLAHTEVWRSRA